MKQKDANNKPIPTGNHSGNAHDRRLAARVKAGKKDSFKKREVKE